MSPHVFLVHVFILSCRHNLSFFCHVLSCVLYTYRLCFGYLSSSLPLFLQVPFYSIPSVFLVYVCMLVSLHTNLFLLHAFWICGMCQYLCLKFRFFRMCSWLMSPSLCICFNFFLCFHDFGKLPSLSLCLNSHLFFRYSMWMFTMIVLIPPH